MENDDRQVGRILSRREVLVLLGATGSAAIIAAGFKALLADSVYLPVVVKPEASRTTTTIATATLAPTETATLTPAATSTSAPACIVSPELTEGPYFVDEQLNRSDIRSDPSDGSIKEGVLLQLTLRVYAVNSNGCNPLAGAYVDIWHCDALGLYSDVASEGTAGQKFLRGYQLTDANGVVQFTTIYPGWYTGRAVHIHFKVRADLTSNPSYEFTSQFFFDDTLTDEVHEQQPYASKGSRDTRNDDDNIYQNGGAQLLLALSETEEGYATTFDIGMQIN